MERRLFREADHVISPLRGVGDYAKRYGLLDSDFTWIPNGYALADVAADAQYHHSYFVVAHFHYALFAGGIMGVMTGVYYWLPKWTGHMYSEPLGKLHFWLTFIGFHLTFLVQHWLGNQGMPRRYADYLPSDGFTTLNMISTAGALVLGLSTLPFLWNVFRSYRYGEVVTVDDPWGFGNSLEWATSCPPPRHNFTTLPRIRSESPAFDLHHPEATAQGPHRVNPLQEELVAATDEEGTK